MHVTQGTVADGGLNALDVPTLDALAGEDVLVVAGTGRGRLGAVPADVRAAPFIPHAGCCRRPT